MFCPKGGEKKYRDSQIKFVYIVVHYLDHVAKVIVSYWVNLFKPWERIVF